MITARGHVESAYFFPQVIVWLLLRSSKDHSWRMLYTFHRLIALKMLDFSLKVEYVLHFMVTEHVHLVFGSGHLPSL